MRLNLDLDKTWTECLRMWEYVSRMCLIKNDSGYWKGVWLDNNFPDEWFECDCFFCEYNGGSEHPEIEGGCKNCPGTLVDPSFHCEKSHEFPIDYDWKENPREFYKKIKQLHKKYLKNKGKTNG